MARQGFMDLPIDVPPASFTALSAFTAEANLWTPNLWSFIPAFDPRAGKAYKISGGGICQSATGINWTFTPRYGQSATPSSNLLLGASAVVPSGGVIPASSPWYFEFTLAFRSLGVAASGSSVTGNGFVVWPTTAVLASQVISMGGTVAATADQTTAQGLILSATCGTSSATNSIQAQWIALQALN
jgi:hypothetical protein